MGKEQELLEASRTGNVAAIEKLIFIRNKKTTGPLSFSFTGFSTSLKRPVNVNCYDGNGDSPLHLAALNGHDEAVHILLIHEANQSLVDQKGCTPLHLAAWNGNTHICNLLLTCGQVTASLVNMQNNDGDTALHCASQYGHSDVVVTLLEHKADPFISNLSGQSPLDLASQYGRLGVVRQLVTRKPALLANQANHKLSPLHLAARSGHRDIAEELLNAGFDINFMYDGSTALHQAALYCKVDVIKLLVERGINLYMKYKEDKTALDLLQKFNTPSALETIELVKQQMELTQEQDPLSHINLITFDKNSPKQSPKISPKVSPKTETDRKESINSIKSTHSKDMIDIPIRTDLYDSADSYDIQQSDSKSNPTIITTTPTITTSNYSEAPHSKVVHSTVPHSTRPTDSTISTNSEYDVPPTPPPRPAAPTSEPPTAPLYAQIDKSKNDPQLKIVGSPEDEAPPPLPPRNSNMFKSTTGSIILHTPPMKECIEESEEKEEKRNPNAPHYIRMSAAPKPREKPPRKRAPTDKSRIISAYAPTSPLPSSAPVASPIMSSSFSELKTPMSTSISEIMSDASLEDMSKSPSGYRDSYGFIGDKPKSTINWDDDENSNLELSFKLEGNAEYKNIDPNVEEQIVDDTQKYVDMKVLEKDRAAFNESFKIKSKTPSIYQNSKEAKDDLIEGNKNDQNLDETDEDNKNIDEIDWNNQNIDKTNEKDDKNTDEIDDNNKNIDDTNQNNNADRNEEGVFEFQMDKFELRYECDRCNNWVENAIVKDEVRGVMVCEECVEREESATLNQSGSRPPSLVLDQSQRLIRSVIDPQQLPTPDHPPPSPHTAEQGILDKIRPLSITEKRLSRDIDTMTEVVPLADISETNHIAGSYHEHDNTEPSATKPHPQKPRKPRKISDKTGKPVVGSVVSTNTASVVSGNTTEKSSTADNSTSYAQVSSDDIYDTPPSLIIKTDNDIYDTPPAPLTTTDTNDDIYDTPSVLINTKDQTTQSNDLDTKGHSFNDKVVNRLQEQLSTDTLTDENLGSPGSADFESDLTDSSNSGTLKRPDKKDEGRGDVNVNGEKDNIKNNEKLAHNKEISIENRDNTNICVTKDVKIIDDKKGHTNETHNKNETETTCHMTKQPKPKPIKRERGSKRNDSERSLKTVEISADVLKEDNSSNTVKPHSDSITENQQTDTDIRITIKNSVIKTSAISDNKSAIDSSDTNLNPDEVFSANTTENTMKPAVLRKEKIEKLKMEEGAEATKKGDDVVVLRRLESRESSPDVSQFSGLFRGSKILDLSPSKGENPILRRSPRLSGVIASTCEDDSAAMATVGDKMAAKTGEDEDEWSQIAEIMESFGATIARESIFVRDFEDDFEKFLAASGPERMKTIGDWLTGLGLSQYENLLVGNGFDDLDFVGTGVLEDSDLQHIGIKDSHHRGKILESAKSLPTVTPIDPDNLPSSIESWLDSLRLSEYNETFKSHYYTDMARVVKLWELELTTVLDITTLGHRKRMLASLGDRSRHTQIDTSFPINKIAAAEPLRNLEWQSPPRSDIPDSPKQSPIDGVNFFKDYTKVRPVNRTLPDLPATYESLPSTYPHPVKRERSVGGSGKHIQDENIHIRPPKTSMKSSVKNWRHQPQKLIKGCCNYSAQYLGSTLVKELNGVDSTREGILKMKKSTDCLAKVPTIMLSMSYKGVKFIDAKSKKVVCEHEITNIFCACQDQNDLNFFAYITKDHQSGKNYCHTFSVRSTDLAQEIILTLGEAFEIAYQMALKDRAEKSAQEFDDQLHSAGTL